MHTWIALTALSLAWAQPETATKEADFTTNGVRIHYAESGSGQPVILIHGWQGDLTTWGVDERGRSELSAPKGFRIIAIDCRGHGRSQKLYEPSQYGKAMASDVFALMDHLKLKRAQIVGYSMGAFIVGKMIELHPERIVSAIMGGQAPILGPAKGNPAGAVLAFAEAVKAGKGMGAYLLSVLPSDKPKPTREQADVIATAMFRGKDLRALAAAGLNFPDLAVEPEKLKRTKLPVLFVYGSKESDSTKRAVEASRQLLTGSKVVEIDGADHVSTLSNPKFGSALMEFLEKTRTRP